MCGSVPVMGGSGSTRSCLRLWTPRREQLSQENTFAARALLRATRAVLGLEER